jgi:hypothetical protein
MIDRTTKSTKSRYGEYPGVHELLEVEDPKRSIEAKLMSEIEAAEKHLKAHGSYIGARSYLGQLGKGF